MLEPLLIELSSSKTSPQRLLFNNLNSIKSMTKRAFNEGRNEKVPRIAIKFLVIMKLTALLMTVAFLNVYATGTSQSVSFEGQNVPLERVFSVVEQQTGYYFLYPKKILKQSKPVSVRVNDMRLEQFLDLIFADQALKYTIGSRTINVSIDRDSHRSSQSASDGVIAEFELQPVPLKGIVRDDSGEPLPGATILVKNSTASAIADAEGVFEIKVNAGDVLVISYVQHEPKEIRVTQAQLSHGVINVTLQKVIARDDEILITTGIFQKADKSYTGASTTVTAKQLQQFGNRNLIVSLKNIDPAFNILENNIAGSDPNNLPDILIRGNSSLPNIDNLDELKGLNTPLIILDGFQSTLEKMLDININEVEAVTILKDAAATAIYGSRGSNGVIVITTKRPAPGELRVTYRADLNFEVADLSGYELLDAESKLALEKRMGYYNHRNASDDIKLKKYYNFLLNEVNQGVNTNWLQLPLRTGVGQRHNLGIAGGEKAFRYSLSTQWNDIEGVMKGSKRSTFNGTLNLAYVYKKVRLSNQTHITEGWSSESPYGTFAEYVKMNPYWRAFDENGSPLKVMGDPGDNTYVLRFSQLPTNPLYNARLEMFDKTKRSELINNTILEVILAEGFRIRGQFGIAKKTSTGDRFRPAEHTAFANYGPQDVFRKGDYAYNTFEGYDYDGSLNLQYSKVFADKHTLFTGLDYNIRQSQGSSLGFLAEGFTNSSLNMMPMALQYAQGQKPSGTESLIRSMGVTANVNYIYNNQYFADLSVRMDGSSQFGKNNRMAPFWAAGIGWNLHNEGFLKHSSVIEKLKLRGSVGVTGSQNFKAYQALSTYRYYPDNRYHGWNGAYVIGMGNEDLKWQQSLQYNFGFNAEFLKGRLQFTGDYYITETNNLLSSIELPASNGYPSYVENIGELSNRGFELKGTGVLVRSTSRGLYWSVTAGVFQNQNKIVKTSGAMKDAQKNRQMAQSEAASVMFVEGHSMNTIWVVPSLGIDPSTGKEIYMDADGKPTYIWNGNDIRAMGITDPKFMGNFSTLLRYSNFTFNASFGYRVGGQQYNQTLISKVENADYSYNVDARVYTDRWEKPGDKAAFKGLDVTERTYRSSRFVQDENLLVCQNVYLEYMLVSEYLKRNLKMSYMQFSVGMAEPFRLSSIKQERGTAYPFSKQFSFSISATF